LFSKVPVDEFPPRVHIFGTVVSEIDVVSVFPDITGEKRVVLRVIDGTDSVMSVDHFQKTIVDILDQPSPSTGKMTGSETGELVPEGIEGTERFGDQFADLGISSR